MNEDIKILENLKEKTYTTEDILGNLVLDEEEYTALQNLIARYKELKQKYNNKLISIQKEREEYEKDYIQKSKIKEKILEYSQTIYYAQTEEGMAELKESEYEEAKYGIQILAELLED